MGELGGDSVATISPVVQAVARIQNAIRFQRIGRSFLLECAACYRAFQQDAPIFIAEEKW